MKTSLRLLAAIFVLSLAGLIRAGDFVSQVVQGGTPPATVTITVPSDRFLVIRNFTQEGPATTRGTVSVTTSTFSAKEVLMATILDPSQTGAGSQEPINDIVIAGPSTVTVTGGDTKCFITYRKGED